MPENDKSSEEKPETLEQLCALSRNKLNAITKNDIIEIILKGPAENEANKENKKLKQDVKNAKDEAAKFKEKAENEIGENSRLKKSVDHLHQYLDDMKGANKLLTEEINRIKSNPPKKQEQRPPSIRFTDETVKENKTENRETDQHDAATNHQKIDVVNSNNENASKSICRYYRKGVCKFGERCRFKHEDCQYYAKQINCPFNYCKFKCYPRKEKTGTEMNKVSFLEKEIWHLKEAMFQSRMYQARVPYQNPTSPVTYPTSNPPNNIDQAWPPLHQGYSMTAGSGS